MSLTFEWDAVKADSNARKHGVTFEEAMTAFGDALSMTIPDPQHSVGERRFVLLGQGRSGRLLVVAHAQDGDIICLISARPATRRERRTYEQG